MTFTYSHLHTERSVLAIVFSSLSASLSTLNDESNSLGCNSVFTWQPQAPNPEPLPPIPEIALELSSPALLVYLNYNDIP